MSLNVEELQIPDRVSGHEVVRVVVTKDTEGEHGFVFMIDATLGSDGDPTIIWGLLLVDLAQHAANSLACAIEDGRLLSDGQGFSKEEILLQIKETFDVEWAEPTGDVTRLADA